MSDNETFDFFLQTDLTYGVGQSREIPSLLDKEDYRNVIVLVDEGVSQHNDYFDEIIELIDNHANLKLVKELRGNKEPEYAYLDSVAGEIREYSKPDLLIGIGGGSTLDICKASAVLQTNPGKAINYRGFDEVENPGIPTLLIPTTAGTGSEVTENAVFIDRDERIKYGINGDYMHATHAILDANWTLSCPYDVAMSSGMDALTHTLESFTCDGANTLTKMFSKKAFQLLFDNLPCLKNDPDNKSKRQKLLLGSYLAGAALFNSGGGIAGALSYPLGVHYGVPHGMGGALFLLDVVEYNVSNGYTGYSELTDLVETNPEMTDEQKSKRFAELMGDLYEKLDVPHSLERWGIDEDDYEDIIESIQPLQEAFDQNPVPFSAETDAPDFIKKHIT